MEERSAFSPRIGGHDQNHGAEISFPALVVGQRRIIHDLKQNVIDVRMRFLDLIKQE